MRRSIVLGLILLFLIANVSALDCQYKLNETYQEFGTYLYDANSEYYGEPLILEDFVSTYCGLNCDGKASFVIRNQYSEDFVLNLTVILFKPASPGNAYPEAKQTIVQEINLPAYGKYKVESGSIGIGGNYFLNDSVTYSISKPERLTLKKGNKNLVREVCEMCGNSVCLNDGSSCNPLYDNSKCGSEVCNIAGVCGSTGSSSVVNCPTGLLNCNNQSCLTPSIKMAGNSYQCEFECDSRTKGCIGVCKTPSVKKSGESYSCDWECKYGSNDNGTCKGSKWPFIYLVGGVALLLAIAGYYRIKAINEKRGRKREKEIISWAEEKAKKIISEAESKLEVLYRDLEFKEETKKRLEKELTSLKDEEKKKDEIRTRLTNINDEIQRLTEEQKRKAEELKEERERLTKERLTPFTNKQGYRVYLNENGYEVIERTGTLFHRWWLEHNHLRKIKNGNEVHHKDFNKRNNDIKNLEELNPEEHSRKHMDKYRQK